MTAKRQRIKRMLRKATSNAESRDRLVVPPRHATYQPRPVTLPTIETARRITKP